MDDDFSSSEDEATTAADPVLKAQFNQAAQEVQNQSVKEEGIKLDTNIMLSLYALFKVATIGKCQDSKPGFFDQKGRAKWTAWNNSSHLSKAEAMEKYIATVKEHYSWAPEEIGACSSSSSQKSKSIMGGNSVSTFAMVPSEEESTEEYEEIFAWVKENQLEAVETWLKEEGNDPNKHDKEKLTLLHWSVDRGHIQMCELLLRNGSNPALPDSDGDTPLDYALTCDHFEIVKLLRSKIEDIER